MEFAIFTAILVGIAVFTYWMMKRDDISMSNKIFAAVFSTFILLSVTVPTTHFGKQSLGSDRMVLNGVVTGKAQEKTSCSHSYSCNCVTSTVGKTTTRTCQTCYEHPYDYAWAVKSDVGKVYIDTIDRRGSKEPPRFTKAIVGEPFSIESSYFNYIKASPLSVFKDYNAYKEIEVFKYPTVYDYYRVKHTVDYKSQYKQGIQQIDTLIAEKLKHTSKKIKGNVVIVFYGGSDDLVQASKVKNFGGRINDVTIMIRADKDGHIGNVGVFSWSKDDLVNVKIRDLILGTTLSLENNEILIDSINEVLLKYYKYRSIEDFSYLKENISTPTWVYVFNIIMALIALVVNVILVRKF